MLGGGGARGAYEAGVLRYVLEELPRELGHSVCFDIIVGTSSGAINAAFLASLAADPARAAEELSERWRNLRTSRVYELGVDRIWKAPLSLLGGRRGKRAEVGLLSAAPLHQMLHRDLNWQGIRDAIGSGALQAVAITATELATSRNIVFIEGSRPRRRPTGTGLCAGHGEIAPSTSSRWRRRPGSREHKTPVGG